MLFNLKQMIVRKYNSMHLNNDNDAITLNQLVEKIISSCDLVVWNDVIQCYNRINDESVKFLDYITEVWIAYKTLNTYDDSFDDDKHYEMVYCEISNQLCDNLFQIFNMIKSQIKQVESKIFYFNSSEDNFI